MHKSSIKNICIILLIVGLIIVATLGVIKVDYYTIDPNSFISIIVTILAIIVALALGIQIYNTFSFEKRVQARIDELAKKSESEKFIHLKEASIDFKLLLMRGLLESNNVDSYCKVICSTIADVVQISSKENAVKCIDAIGLLVDNYNEKLGIETYPMTSTREELIDSMRLVYILLDEINRKKLVSHINFFENKTTI